MLPDNVAIIGQGTWMIEGARGVEQKAIEALRTGLDLGLNHIDTAEMYGNGRSEELVGEAIAGRRAEVFLASKVLPSNASFDGTLRACERTLKRLRTDYLDLYMLHWKGRFAIADTMRALERLVDEKRIRLAGVSNFDVASVKEAQAAMRNHPLASNQVLYHLKDRGIERKLIPYCAEHGIAVVGYSPFGHDAFPRAKALDEVAARNGKTVRQVILNFLTRLPGVFTIPKSGNPDHTRENAGAIGWKLSPEDLAAIDRAFPAPTTDQPLGMI
jgi:diketogulonate reductase-like aldo/keto reductase